MLPFYLEELRRITLREAGLLLTPLPLTSIVIAPFSGVLADKIGTRWLATVGMVIICVGLGLSRQFGTKSSTSDIIWRLVVTGVGQPLFQSPNNSALMGAAPRHQKGIASGFMALTRVVGQRVSVALARAIVTRLGGAAAGPPLRHSSPPTPP